MATEAVRKAALAEKAAKEANESISTEAEVIKGIIDKWASIIKFPLQDVDYLGWAPWNLSIMQN